MYKQSVIKYLLFSIIVIVLFIYTTITNKKNEILTVKKIYENGNTEKKSKTKEIENSNDINENISKNITNKNDDVQNDIIIPKNTKDLIYIDFEDSYQIEKNSKKINDNNNQNILNYTPYYKKIILKKIQASDLKIKK